jgi:dUTP pyrophosphatase
MVKIKFKKLSPDAVIPTKGSKDAACFDFTVTRIQYNGLGSYVLYFGLACEFPKGYVMTIQPRSSLCKTMFVQQNSPGQVDADYRGELQVHMRAIPIEAVYAKHLETYELAYPKLPFNVGDRCCQAKLEEVIPIEFEEVEELSSTERGTGGYGSTGK